MPTSAPRGSLTHPIGLRIKQLVLLFGAGYLGIVTLANAVNPVMTAGDRSAAFLNSHNVDHVQTFVMHTYG